MRLNKKDYCHRKSLRNLYHVFKMRFNLWSLTGIWNLFRVDAENGKNRNKRRIRQETIIVIIKNRRASNGSHRIKKTKEKIHNPTTTNRKKKTIVTITKLHQFLPRPKKTPKTTAPGQEIDHIKGILVANTSYQLGGGGARWRSDDDVTPDSSK